MPHGASPAEMAATAAEETPAPSSEDDVRSTESTEGHGEDEEKGPAEPETDEQHTNVETKIEAEASEKQPAADADKATGEAVTDTGVATEGTVTPEEPEHKPESQQMTGDVSNELANVNAAKEESGDDSRCSVMDCEKSKPVCEDGEKASGELADKRRSSVEMSSLDGEPLSRMDSEDRCVGEITGLLGVNGPDNNFGFVVEKEKQFTFL